MKLRRALVSLATTAVIAPAALLAAPAAFAASVPIPPPSESPTPAPAPKGLTPPAHTIPKTPVSIAPSTPAVKDVWSTDCTKADIDTGSVVRMSLSGLPSKIVVGSGWHAFTLIAANPTRVPLGEVRWIAGVDNESDTLLRHSRIEYFNGKTWVDVGQQAGLGVAFGQTNLGAYQKVDIHLRVSIDSSAPAGMSGAVGIGGYIDTGKNCAHHTYTTYAFTTLAAGSKAEHPAPAKPNATAKPPAHIKTQEGGTAPLPATGTVAHTTQSAPATGSLAHTGASSALPTIAGISGAAIAAGAGVMFVVRRRKAGSAA